MRLKSYKANDRITIKLTDAIATAMSAERVSFCQRYKGAQISDAALLVLVIQKRIARVNEAQHARVSEDK